MYKSSESAGPVYFGSFHTKPRNVLMDARNIIVFVPKIPQMLIMTNAGRTYFGFPNQSILFTPNSDRKKVNKARLTVE